MSYVSTYPKTFDRFLRFNEITFNAAAGSDTERLYGTIDIWLTGAFERIKTHCNQTIQATTGKVFTFDFNELVTDTGGDYYLPPILNVPFAVTSIGYKSTVFDTLTAISSGDYLLVTVNGNQRIYFRAWSGYNTGYLTATLGYSDTNMPENIQQVAVEMASTIYRESHIGGDSLGKKQESENMQGVSTTTIYYELTPRHEKLLKPYTVAIFP